MIKPPFLGFKIIPLLIKYAKKGLIFAKILMKTVGKNKKVFS